MKNLEGINTMTDAINLVIASAKDRIDGEIENGDTIDSPYCRGALECAGMALSMIAYQRTGEGCGICDAIAMAGMENGVNNVESHAARFIAALGDV